MTKKLAFLGYGLRSKTMLQAFREIEADISVAAVADPRWEQIKEENAGDPLFAEARYFENADALLGGCEPDGVFIGTRCPLHTPLAVEVLKRDIPLFLEKPVCISEAQYRTLREAAEGKLDRVVVSFPLRVADITVRLRQLVESGALGRVTMVQAVNNVPYGSVYYHSWYRDPSLTGGLFLQKTTHDIDYICHAAGLTPKRVFAHTEKLYYKGDRPAGLHCPHPEELGQNDEHHDPPEEQGHQQQVVSPVRVEDQIDTVDADAQEPADHGAEQAVAAVEPGVLHVGPHAEDGADAGKGRVAAQKVVDQGAQGGGEGGFHVALAHVDGERLLHGGQLLPLIPYSVP